MRAPIYPTEMRDDDERFSIGLLVEIAQTLEAHGYGRATEKDYVRLQQFLYAFLYGGCCK